MDRPAKLERVIGSLVRVSKRREDTWKYRSNGFRCAECDTRITRDQYRESVHCSACLHEMDKGGTQ